MMNTPVSKKLSGIPRPSISREYGPLQLNQLNSWPKRPLNPIFPETTEKVWQIYAYLHRIDDLHREMDA